MLGRKRQQQALADATAGTLRGCQELVTKVDQHEAAIAGVAKVLAPVAGSAVLHNRLLGAITKVLTAKGLVTMAESDDAMAVLAAAEAAAAAPVGPDGGLAA